MKINEGFVVERPIAEMWPLFKDVPELARCLPGAELTADHGDGSYDGKVSVKLGPIATSFEGKATVDFDESAHTAKIKGRGVDRSGGSQGQVMVDIALDENEEHHTAVSIDAEVTLVGPIAQFGSTGLVSEVSRRLIDEFSQCVHAKLDAETAEEAAAVTAGQVKGFSLVVASTWSSLIGWLKRVFSRRRS
ncbi:MAG: SRPBCC family protein [Acidimicrobiia bacterium]|nr:SRPBCC family protein [Acidimicrobiia bacterium]